MKNKFSYFLILILLTIFLSGCSVFYLSNFVLPDDIDFIKTINELDTPEKICSYMKDNFEYKFYLFKTLTPYELYIKKKGDCDIFANFAQFIANHHGYETYQIKIFNYTFVTHYLAVYVENNKYTFSSNMDYYPWLYESFADVIKCYTNDYKYYEVYDYNMNLIEKVQK